MYELYLIIGLLLVLSGTVYLIYIFLLINTTKKKKCFIPSLSDGFGTIILGFFYLYCYIEFIKNMNNEADITQDMDIVYLNVTEHDDLNPDVFNNNPSTDGNKTDQIFQESNEIRKIVENLKNDHFNTDYNSYKSFLENQFNVTNHSPGLINILKQSGEHLNTTEFYKKFIKRQQRAAIRDFSKYFNFTVTHSDEKCLKIAFMKYATIIYSFSFCLICLINNTLNYYKCDLSINKNNIEDIRKSNNEVGIQSNEKQQDKETREHNMDMFLAKSSIKPSIKENTSVTYPVSSGNASSMLIRLLLTWIFPGICLLILSILMRKVDEKIENLNIPSNFNETTANTEVINIINKRINVSSTNENTENIVKNVYDIVKKASRDNAPNAKIVNIFGNRLQDQNECSIQTSSLKIFILVLFVYLYFIMVMYSKVIHTKMEMTDMTNQKILNLILRSFNLLWLPGAFEVTLRNLLNQDLTMCSDITLFIGNLFVVVNNIINYKMFKRIFHSNSLNSNIDSP